MGSLYSSGKRKTNKLVKYVNREIDVRARKENKAGKERKCCRGRCKYKCKVVQEALRDQMTFEQI